MRVPTIERSDVDKSQWPRGEWDNEPDFKQWEDAETRLPCLAVRNQRWGNWCGYVGVREGHSCFELEYDKCYEKFGWDAALDCHGSLTYSEFCDGRICHATEGGHDKVWWLGFDCHHCNDLAPGYGVGLPAEFNDFNDPDRRYRSLTYVEKECTNLAAGLHSLAKK